jgi:hypothetical protein
LQTDQMRAGIRQKVSRQVRWKLVDLCYAGGKSRLQRNPRQGKRDRSPLGLIERSEAMVDPGAHLNDVLRAGRDETDLNILIAVQQPVLIAKLFPAPPSTVFVTPKGARFY